MNSAQTRPEANTPVDGTVPRILAVDDHRANLLALEAILQPLGADVVSVTTGEDALIEVLRSDFALILMDVQMPGLDGFATTSIIKTRERSRHVPIIFLTAISREEEHMFQGYAYGAVDYMVKPFNPAILRAKVGVFVDLWNHKQIVRRQERELVKHERERLNLKGDATYRRLADAVPDLLWGLDASGVVLAANRAAREFAGETGLGRHAFELEIAQPEEMSRQGDQLRRAMSGGEPVEWTARLRDGRSYRLRMTPERVPDGPATGWSLAATDIDDILSGDAPTS